jgi:hypothetical protein
MKVQEGCVSVIEFTEEGTPVQECSCGTCYVERSQWHLSKGIFEAVYWATDWEGLSGESLKACPRCRAVLGVIERRPYRIPWQKVFLVLQCYHHLIATAVIWGLTDAQSRAMHVLSEVLGVDLEYCFEGRQMLDESSVCRACPYAEPPMCDSGELTLQDVVEEVLEIAERTTK